MKYEKPEVQIRATAAAIQGGKGSNMTIDSPDYHTNGAAYEADE